MIHRRQALSLALGAAALVSTQSLSQTYPSQTVRVVVPFQAGSATDIVARIIVDKLAGPLGQNVVVENRPGLPGTASVADSPPDGHTLMLTSNGHTITGIVNKNLSFDPVKSFAGVTLTVDVPYAILVPADFPAKNVKDLIALAKANPGKLNFASSGGVGSATYIATVVFMEAAGIEMVSVTYKGAPDSLNSVMRGDTQVYFAPLAVSTELMAAGKVRALAVTTAERVPTMKDLPTIAESGLPTFKWEAWFGVMVPAKTPREIVARLNTEIIDVLKRPDVRERLLASGTIPRHSTPEEFDRLIAEETAKLADMLKDRIK
jgi:tripartite-type tricarboxylate transporter receptor subunit TctC